MFEQNLKNGPRSMTTISVLLIQIPFTSNNEDFSLNITPVEIEVMKDAFRDIQFHRVMEYLLPRFNNTMAG